MIKLNEAGINQDLITEKFFELLDSPNKHIQNSLLLQSMELTDRLRDLYLQHKGCYKCHMDKILAESIYIYYQETTLTDHLYKNKLEVNKKPPSLQTP